MAVNPLRVLILGGYGMLGHKLWQIARGQLETFVTLRNPLSSYKHASLFDPQRTLSGVDATNIESIQRAIDEVQPSVVVNCIGIVKQRKEARDPLISITVNSLFPHQLKSLCDCSGARLIHISTDCVFSGNKGNYGEDELPDARDLYGQTKYLGEVQGEHCLTIRTSIIGPELESRLGLFEWFLSQAGQTVRGYTRALYSGFTTQELSRILIHTIRNFPDLCGLYHVASRPISKHDLLGNLNHFFDYPLEIQPDDNFFCDRSLNASRFWNQIGQAPPAWDEMIQDLANDYQMNGENHGT